MKHFLASLSMISLLVLLASCEKKEEDIPVYDKGPVLMDGYEGVDLGLTVKWANYNIGAESPEEFGQYFAWGDTVPSAAYTYFYYKWYSMSKSGPTKYFSDSYYGEPDYKMSLDLVDDAAHAIWGGKWRLPSESEWRELFTYCTWEWTELNGVSGYKVTSNKPGNTNHIFLPAAGHLNEEGEIEEGGECGKYWSSSLFGMTWELAYYTNLNSQIGQLAIGRRPYCYSIRPVHVDYFLPGTVFD